MPQIFQVLRCYKCSVFQVHQTRKDNKWSCKVCGEKQSVKRHYGIGTAKDCRLHVQKLNSMRADKDESISNHINSENSDYEENITEKVNFNKAEVEAYHIKKESKWSAYVEKKEISDVNETEFIDNVEVCLELPQKRKINRKKRPFKVSKVCNKSNETIEISNDNESNNHKHTINSTNLLCDNNIRNNFESSREIVNSNNKQNTCISRDLSTCEFQTNKASKWAEFIDTHEANDVDQHNRSDEVEDAEYNDHYGDIEHNDYHRDKDVKHYDELEIKYGDRYKADVECNRDGNNIKNDILHKSATSNGTKALFTLCEESDLDSILDF